MVFLCICASVYMHLSTMKLIKKNKDKLTGDIELDIKRRLFCIPILSIAACIIFALSLFD